MIEYLGFNSDNIPPAPNMLADLQKQIGHVLPAAFLEVILSNTLIIAVDNEFEAGDNSSSIENFIPLNNMATEYAQFCAVKNVTNLLPFAEDGMGNHICIHLEAGPTNGEISFWDHEEATAVKVFGSIYALISKLEKPTEDLTPSDQENFEVTISADAEKLFAQYKKKGH